MSNGINYDSSDKLIATVGGTQVLTASAAGVYVSGNLNVTGNIILNGQSITASGGGNTGSSAGLLEQFVWTPQDVTTTSTSFTDITGLSCSITQSEPNQKLAVSLDITNYSAAGNSPVSYTVVYDNVEQATRSFFFNNTNVHHSNNFIWVFTGSATTGVKDIKIQWKVAPSGDARINTDDRAIITVFNSVSSGNVGNNSWSDVAPNYVTTTKDVVISGSLNTTSSNTWSKPQIGAITTYNNVSASTTIDLAASNNFKLLLSGNISLTAPSNITEGQSGLITIIQPNNNYYTITYDTFWKFASGSDNVLTVNSGAIDVLAYYVASSSYAICNLIKDFA